MAVALESVLVARRFVTVSAASLVQEPSGFSIPHGQSPRPHAQGGGREEGGQILARRAVAARTGLASKGAGRPPQGSASSEAGAEKAARHGRGPSNVAKGIMSSCCFCRHPNRLLVTHTSLRLSSYAAKKRDKITRIKAEGLFFTKQNRHNRVLISRHQ